MSPLNMRQAADALGVSVRTLQRRRDELIAAGATHGPSGWSIPEAALDTLRVGPAPVAPVTPETSPRVAPTLSPPVTPTPDDARADNEQTQHGDKPDPTPTDRERLADARARVEMLERERADLIKRAETAEATAQQATATAAALALRMRELEVSRTGAEMSQQTHTDGSQTDSETEQGRRQGPGAQRDSGRVSVRSVRGWVGKVVRGGGG